MDTTLRYVQQFGRSKRDNLKPSLLSKYHVQQTIEVFPFRIMDFGCFASTADGLSGLLHNSEMPSTLQSNLQEFMEKQQPLTVKINKYDRRTGEVAFALESKDKPKEQTVTATAAPTDEATKPVTVEVTTATAATEAATTAQPSSQANTVDLEPFQFSTSQPVVVEPVKDSLSERLDQETADIQKFLETVIKSPLSSAAQKRLRDLLQQNSIFRFTYTMQTVVDDFEPDVGMQLVTAIERVLNSQKR
jgi:predicted RNA-binding protein with RPS1 domain